MLQRESIDALVKAAFEAGKGRYGAERIFYDLAEQNNPLDIKTIRKKPEKTEINCKGYQAIQGDRGGHSSIEIVEKLEKMHILIKSGIPKSSDAMPNFKKYSYDKNAMIVINFEEQLQSGSFELLPPHEIYNGFLCFPI